jgi:NTE family protein
MKTFALALGSGGARGIAHIAVIEALDEIGVKPAAIAGTSIGALVGAAYAAGMSGKEIRHHEGPRWDARPFPRRRLQPGDAIDAEKFCAQFLPEGVPSAFSERKIPLIAMATDLHRRQETPLSAGPLRPALAASIAIPGLFRPVVIDGRILIDGGTTNPLPYDMLAGRADIVVAVDVFGVPAAERADMPSAWECVYMTVLVMGGAIVAAKLNHAAPDVLIRPNVTIFRTMEFYQASAILRAAEATKAELRDKLDKLLSGAP